MNTDFKRRGKFIFFPIVITGFILAAGYLVQCLWNHILPEVIPAVKALSYKQAVGLLVLCRLLFGGFRGGPGHRGGPPWRRKYMQMSDAEREKLKEDWARRCGPK